MSTPSILPDLPAFDLGIYRHFKGSVYFATGLGRHAEILIPIVAYSAITREGRGNLWFRPLENWNQIVVWPDGKSRPRFELILKTDAAAIEHFMSGFVSVKVIDAIQNLK